MNEILEGLEQHAAATHQDGEGYTADYLVCNICSYPQWIGSKIHKDEPEKREVRWHYTDFRVLKRSFDKRSCPRCDEIEQRAPEIFSWITDAMTIRDSVERDSSNLDRAGKPPQIVLTPEM